jgi:hypothetical protein
VALWTKDGEFEVLKEDLVTSVTPKKESASPGGKKKQKNKSKKVEKEVESGSDIEEDEDDEDEEGDEEMSE